MSRSSSNSVSRSTLTIGAGAPHIIGATADREAIGTTQPGGAARHPRARPPAARSVVPARSALITRCPLRAVRERESGPRSQTLADRHDDVARHHAARLHVMRPWYRDAPATLDPRADQQVSDRGENVPSLIDWLQEMWASRSTRSSSRATASTAPWTRPRPVLAAASQCGTSHVRIAARRYTTRQEGLFSWTSPSSAPATWPAGSPRAPWPAVTRSRSRAPSREGRCARAGAVRRRPGGPGRRPARGRRGRSCRPVRGRRGRARPGTGTSSTARWSSTSPTRSTSRLRRRSSSRPGRPARRSRQKATAREGRQGLQHHIRGHAREGRVAGQPLDVLIASDDDDGKEAVSRIVERRRPPPDRRRPPQARARARGARLPAHGAAAASRHRLLERGKGSRLARGRARRPVRTAPAQFS